jgi:hypothetical protein
MLRSTLDRNTTDHGRVASRIVALPLNEPENDRTHPFRHKMQTAIAVLCLPWYQVWQDYLQDHLNGKSRADQRQLDFPPCCLTQECYVASGWKGSGRLDSRSTGPENMSLLTALRRQSFTRRCSVRSCPSVKTPGLSARRRSRTCTAVRSGSASSHSRICGQTVAMAFPSRLKITASAIFSEIMSVGAAATDIGGGEGHRQAEQRRSEVACEGCRIWPCL